MTTYTLEPIRENVIGCFSREHAPILTIQPGDTVRYRTLDATWGLEPLTDLKAQRRKLEPRTDADKGHCLTGPVAIAGAQRGMTLEVHIGAIRPGAWGFCTAAGWRHIVNERLELLSGQDEVLHQWTLDADAMIGRNQHGHTVTLRPFMGVMGMPPDEPGVHPTPPPRTMGGNLDCKELVSGSILYLPIPVDGGLFYVGDGHAAQGDGEVSVTAIECPMEQLDLTFFVRDDMPLTTPRAKTPVGWLTLGFDQDIEKAMYFALDDMLNLIGGLFNVDRANALALASLAVDLRITQIVNGVRGVHAVLPHGAIR
ncbi:MAG: acetamidase/formamidase family protein [Chloroflexota bacterium]|nr:acetamidase/formamidase family protein [Chloroflexota bacterium]